MPKSVEITEYHDIRDVVASIKVSDADDRSTLNGKARIEIFGGTGRDLFGIQQIDPWNAQVYAKQSLKQFFGNYTLIVRVQDLGTPPNVVESTLDINVLDFNDHAPVFQTANDTIRIAENVTVGTVIAQVRAIDDDVGPNAEVRYKLKADPTGNFKAFSIDPNTGTITLNQPLNRDSQKLYEIHVEAYDQGYPTALSSEMTLVVYVRNINDYEPHFLLDEIKVNFTGEFRSKFFFRGKSFNPRAIAENSYPGTEKVKLPDTVERDEVDDLDDPPSVVCYFIIFGNNHKIFHLDPMTHILTVTLLMSLLN